MSVKRNWKFEHRERMMTFECRESPDSDGFQRVTRVKITIHNSNTPNFPHGELEVSQFEEGPHKSGESNFKSNRLTTFPRLEKQDVLNLQWLLGIEDIDE